jgi:hypothetical protein
MKTVILCASNDNFQAHNILGGGHPPLTLAKRIGLPASLEHVIGVDVESFRNLEDFLSPDESCDEIVALLPH